MYMKVQNQMWKQPPKEKNHQETWGAADAYGRVEHTDVLDNRDGPPKAHVKEGWQQPEPLFLLEYGERQVGSG